MKSTSRREVGVFLLHLLSHPVCWICLAAATLLLDWLTDPAISFPLAFIFPVGLAAWYRGFRWGAVFAVGLTSIRFGFIFFRDMPWSAWVSGMNFGIRIAVLCGIAWLIARIVGQQRHIQNLERLLPICAWCGKIRDEEKAWQRLDSYLAMHTDLAFTHTICAECAAKQFPKTAAENS